MVTQTGPVRNDGSYNAGAKPTNLEHYLCHRVGFLFVFYCCYYFFKCQGQLKASWFPVENSTIYLYEEKVIGVRKTLWGVGVIK